MKIVLFRLRTQFGLCCVSVIAALMVFSMSACSTGNGDSGGGGDPGNPELPGNIVIQVSGGGDPAIGKQLNAVYSGGGTEVVSYQWNRSGNTSPVGTSQTYTPDIAGVYTVTVSAEGYRSKTSAAVTVTAGISVPGATLTEQLAWISSNSVSNSVYTVDVKADEVITSKYLSYFGKTNITINLNGGSAERTIRLSSNTGYLFSVANSVTLILGNNITLMGQSSNNNSVVIVNDGGSLVMNDGSKITGNVISDMVIAIYSNGGGGVSINGANASFTMNGGEISGNKVTYTSAYGGALYISRAAKFTMNGGEISGNTAASYGGGICLYAGNITMNKGEISGNTANTMSGGGVYLNQVAFARTRGTINGTDAVNGNGVENSSGILTNNGSAVYVYTGFPLNQKKYRETTVGADEEFSYTKTSPYFFGDWITE